MLVLRASLLSPPTHVRVLTYNVLANVYAASERGRDVLFRHVPEPWLDAAYRQQLALQEVRMAAPPPARPPSWRRADAVGPAVRSPFRPVVVPQVLDFKSDVVRAEGVGEGVGDGGHGDRSRWTAS